MNTLFWKKYAGIISIVISLSLLSSPFMSSAMKSTTSLEEDFLMTAADVAIFETISESRRNPVIDDSLLAGANYLRHAQADVTEDNAGNGDPDVPDDPDDAGWDWVMSIPQYSHSPTDSPTNIYGVTALGLYYGYLNSDDDSLLIAMQDVANEMVSNSSIRSGADAVFLCIYQNLVSGSPGIYSSAAKNKLDQRLVTYGSATAFAQYIRDVRASQGYENGIIPWDISFWVIAAMMIDEFYAASANDYDQVARDMAEVIYQDSFLQNPGYFDLTTNKNNGWDPTYSNLYYYWYTLGISGLISSFYVADVHTDQLDNLSEILLQCQYSSGAFSFCYGANLDDEDWQSTAYSVKALGDSNPFSYQFEINDACFWIASTQNSSSGAWEYSSGSHYPEICGELVTALSYYKDIYYLDILVEGQGSVEVNPDRAFYIEGEGVWCTATPQQGWDFVNWKGASGCCSNPIFFYMNSNRTVTAVFEPTPPITPDPPVGPISLETDEIGLFEVVGEDPDGDNIRCHINWGDGTFSEWSEGVSSGSTFSYSKSYGLEGVYAVSAQLMDENGALSDWSEPLVVVVENNVAPLTPSPPTGPSSLQINEIGIYVTHTTDPNQDEIQYRFDWGDGTFSDWSDFVGSGEAFSLQYSWPDVGTYLVKSQARDDQGVLSSWSEALSVVVSNPQNNAPQIPDIDGPSEGKFGTEYTFSFTATDPDGDDVKFIIDWGDESTEETIFVASGETIEVSHTWESESRDGETVDTAYMLKAKAVDTNDAESDWGIMDVTMPLKNNNAFLEFVEAFFIYLFERFSFLETLFF